MSRLVIDWQISLRFAVDWRRIGPLASHLQCIDTPGVGDSQPIGLGWTPYWHHIGTGLTSHRSGLVLHWQWIGNKLAKEWHYIGIGLVGVAMDWHLIDMGLGQGGHQICNELASKWCMMGWDWHLIGAPVIQLGSPIGFGMILDWHWINIRLTSD